MYIRTASSLISGTQHPLLNRVLNCLRIHRDSDRPPISTCASAAPGGQLHIHRPAGNWCQQNSTLTPSKIISGQMSPNSCINFQTNQIYVRGSQKKKLVLSFVLLILLMSQESKLNIHQIRYCFTFTAKSVKAGQMSCVSITHCNLPPSRQEDSLVNFVFSKRAALEHCYCCSLTAKESRSQVRASPERRVLFSQRLQLAEGQWGLCVSFKRDERWRSTSVTRSES